MKIRYGGERISASDRRVCKSLPFTFQKLTFYRAKAYLLRSKSLPFAW